MRFRTLEIRWHDSKPISSCEFQPVLFKKARPSPGQEQNFAGQAYRLATAGEDNHIRIWMIHPNIRPTCIPDSELAVPRPPRVEYLATLSRHSAAVNVVRFSPNGELIASAGDDGMIIIWAPSATPQTSTYGSDLSPEDLQHEKEYWKPRTTFRCTTMQVYDLAWSPTGEYIIAGSTDNAARIFSSSDGKCVYEIAEHNHYVQGVAWDPLNEYIATQSSDRSMHIYRISTKQGAFEVHAVGKNTRMPHQHHSRTPSSHGHGSSRPRMFRRESTASDVESVASEYPREKDDASIASTSGIQHNHKDAPLTPATSVASTPSISMFPPPPIDKPSSRRSSFSGSNAPGSPSTFSRYGRSPSPMPALPAIRTLPPTAAWTSVKLYGDESFTNFFRRLTFSPDGGLLLTPAGQFEDPTVIPGASSKPGDEVSGTPTRGRRGRPSINTADIPTPSSSASSVYIYSRANFARPPIAQLPGHKKASVAVRFNPILFELRQGVHGTEAFEPKTAVLEKGTDGHIEVDVGSVSTTGDGASAFNMTPSTAPQRIPLISSQSTSIAAPAPLLAASNVNFNPVSSPAISPVDLHPPTPAASKPPTPVLPPHSSSQTGSGTTSTTASVFALPYRMLFAVVTMDTLAIYDTQQAGPICLLTKLHYDEFTDLTWSPDGQCLILSSRDGYCTLIIFDEILPPHHTQQHALQLQSIAHHHSVPLITSNSSTLGHAHSVAGTPLATPASSTISLPHVVTSSVPAKRSEPPLTPATSTDGESSTSAFSFPPASKAGQSAEEVKREKNPKSGTSKEPPKKKRRVALTRVGDLE